MGRCVLTADRRKAKVQSKPVRKADLNKNSFHLSPLPSHLNVNWQSSSHLACPLLGGRTGRGGGVCVHVPSACSAHLTC